MVLARTTIAKQSTEEGKNHIPLLENGKKERESRTLAS